MIPFHTAPVLIFIAAFSYQNKREVGLCWCKCDYDTIYKLARLLDKHLSTVICYFLGYKGKMATEEGYTRLISKRNYYMSTLSIELYND